MEPQPKFIKIEGDNVGHLTLTFKMKDEDYALQERVFIRHWRLERQLLSYKDEGKDMTSEEMDDLAYERNQKYREATYYMQRDMGVSPLTFDDLKLKEDELDWLIRYNSILALQEELNCEEKMRAAIKNHDSEDDFYNTLVYKFIDFIDLYKDDYGESGAVELGVQDMRAYLKEMYG